MTTSISSPAETSDKEGVDHLRSLAATARVIRVIHPDLFGRQRGKQFPARMADSLLDGLAYSKVSLAEDLMGVPVSAAEFPDLAGHPDLHARIDASSAFVPPWEPDAVWVLSRLFEQGRPSALCVRSQVQAAHMLLQSSLGFSAVAAGEPEFYLFENGQQGSRPIPYATDGVSYTIDRITDPSGAVGRIHRQLLELPIGVTAINREFSPGQFEVNLGHAAVETAADQAFLLKSAVKELAILEGLRANFMAKPLSGEEGSSLHVHMSLWTLLDGRGNVFASPDASISDTARHAIAGVQEHAAAIVAFAAPTVNSYKRLFGEGLSPTTSNWAEDNRFSFLRVPGERGSATRFELRAGDASANPHLLLAAILHAVRDGIERKLQPQAEGLPLPRTLAHALDALNADPLMTQGFGGEFIATYTALKRAEIRSLDALVSDTEWNIYHTHA